MLDLLLMVPTEDLSVKMLMIGSLADVWIRVFIVSTEDLSALPFHSTALLRVFVVGSLSDVWIRVFLVPCLWLMVPTEDLSPLSSLSFHGTALSSSVLHCPLLSLTLLSLGSTSNQQETTGCQLHKSRKSTILRLNITNVLNVKEHSEITE